MPEARSIFPTDKMGGFEKSYFKMIDKVMADDKEELVSNGRPAHAIYLLYKFLKAAEQSVQITSGRLTRKENGWKAWSEKKLAETAISFLSKPGTSLEIVIMDKSGIDVDAGQEPETHPFIRAIKDAEDQIRGAVSVVQLATEDDSRFYRKHFCIMDKKHVRVETDPGEIKAFVSFNDKEFGELLASSFDTYRPYSKTLFEISAPA